MASSPELHESQIAAARAQAWHQAGEPLLTLEAARAWLNQYGLVLFAPRGNSLGTAAPSLVEATLGEAKTSVTLAESGTARALTARLVGEGSAVPLNLLGGPGDLPDFLVSAQAFPFVFTLRGDKGWKRAPETSGAVKVTPLGLRVFELLTERGALSVAEMVSEIGREVTESAVARALTDLWQLLRVIPVLQQGEGETRWELTTTRFLKGIKAGANAGQPTALSALASLYLAQALVASEEEIAAFLSPLTARSRVRDVLHGLVAGRQLAEGVLNGKAVLSIPDQLPDLSQFGAAASATEETGGESSTEGSSEPPQATEETGRIRRFAGKGKSAERNFRGKPVPREGAKRPPFRTRSEGDARPPREGRGATERPERRPFTAGRERPSRREEGPEKEFKPRRQGAERPAFNRPWDEERSARPPRGDRAGRESGRDKFAGRPSREGQEGSGAAERRPGRPFSERRDSRPPRREGDRPYRPRKTFDESREVRPGRPSSGQSDRPQRPFRPRSEEGGASFRPRPEGEGRPFRPRAEAGSRPFRPRPQGENRPYKPRNEGDRPFRPRPEGGGDRPFRPREGGAREGRGPKRPGSDRGPRPEGRGGFRPAFKKGPSKFAGKPRPERPARKPRLEDEA